MSTQGTIEDLFILRRMKVGTVNDVRISFVPSDNVIAVHPVFHTYDLDIVSDAANISGNREGISPMERNQIKVGQMCLSKYDDGNWNRAVIVEVHDESVRLYYIDYGNKDFTSFNNIFPLEEHLFWFPMQAVPVLLQQNDNSKNYSENELDDLYKNDLHKVFRMEIKKRLVNVMDDTVEKVPGEPEYEVVLLDLEEECGFAEEIENDLHEIENEVKVELEGLVATEPVPVTLASTSQSLLAEIGAEIDNIVVAVEENGAQPLPVDSADMSEDVNAVNGAESGDNPSPMETVDVAESLLTEIAIGNDRDAVIVEENSAQPLPVDSADMSEDANALNGAESGDNPSPMETVDVAKSLLNEISVVIDHLAVAVEANGAQPLDSADISENAMNGADSVDNQSPAGTSDSDQGLEYSESTFENEKLRQEILGTKGKIGEIDYNMKVLKLSVGKLIKRFEDYPPTVENDLEEMKAWTEESFEKEGKEERETCLKKLDNFKLILATLAGLTIEDDE